jgi:hypothetical protein
VRLLWFSVWFLLHLGAAHGAFKLGELDRDAYIRFGIWTVAVIGAVVRTKGLGHIDL